MGPGSQTIRLVFDQPQRLRRICLVFEQNETARTQVFVVRWPPDDGYSVREIVRQQWNFRSPDPVREVEEYQVELSAVTVLEVTINPDIAGGASRASLKKPPPFVTSQRVARDAQGQCQNQWSSGVRGTSVVSGHTAVIASSIRQTGPEFSVIRGRTVASREWKQGRSGVVRPHV